MADFFSQFQVHPPTQELNRPGVSPLGYGGPAGEAGPYTQDFNLGGFSPANDRTPVPGWTGGPINADPPPVPAGGYDPSKLLGGMQTPSDPRLSPLPQPWQQGPGGSTLPYATAPPGSTMPNLNDGRQTGPEWGGWGNDFPNLGGVSPQMPSLPPGNLKLTPQQAQQMGTAFGSAGRMIHGSGGGTSLARLSPSNAQQVGQGMGQAVAGMQSSGALGSPMVQMMAPDGSHSQFVDPAHVQHYQGLGATIYDPSQMTQTAMPTQNPTQVTGPQLTGSSYGGGY